MPGLWTVQVREVSLVLMSVCWAVSLAVVVLVLFGRSVFVARRCAIRKFGRLVFIQRKNLGRLCKNRKGHSLQISVFSVFNETSTVYV